MERRISGPDWELGTDKQAAQWLGIEVQEWRKLTSSLGMEPDVRISRQTYYWSWRQAVGVSLIGPNLPEGKESAT